MCGVCRKSRLALDRLGETTVGEVAIHLLSTEAADEQIAAVIDALATDRHLEVAMFAPAGPGSWRVIAAANPDRHGDEVIVGERFPELAEARQTGRPAQHVLVSTDPDTATAPASDTGEVVALALPVWMLPDRAEPLVLRVGGARLRDEATHALVVLLAHLLSHRLGSIPPEIVAHQLGCLPRQGFACSHPNDIRTSQVATMVLDGRGATLEREMILRQALEHKIDELAEANRQLEQCARLGTRLITDAAHELRSPVAILRSYLETLTIDLTDGLTLEHREFLRGALAGADRLQVAVDELLDVAALESGDISFEVGPVDLDDLLADLGRVLVPTAARAGVSIRMEVGDHLIVRADRMQLERIVRAVIGTAVRFTAGGGSVRVKSRAGGAEAKTTIEALDVVLDPGDLEHAFDPFYRARRGPANTGFSLGLVTARRLAHLLGSRLDLETTPAGGVRIVLAVPLWTSQP